MTEVGTLMSSEETFGTVKIAGSEQFPTLLEFTGMLSYEMADALLAYVMRCMLTHKRVTLMMPADSMDVARGMHKGQVVLDAVLTGYVGGVVIRKREGGRYEVTSHT